MVDSDRGASDVSRRYMDLLVGGNRCVKCKQGSGEISGYRQRSVQDIPAFRRFKCGWLLDLILWRVKTFFAISA